MKRCCLIGVLIVAFLFSGCDTYAVIEYYPWYRSDAWYCAELDLEITFELKENGDIRETPYTELVMDGEVHRIVVDFMADAIMFSSEPNEDNISSILVDGVWEYVDGNIVVTIYEDHLFDGQYSTLVFVPQS